MDKFQVGDLVIITNPEATSLDFRFLEGKVFTVERIGNLSDGGVPRNSSGRGHFWFKSNHNTYYCYFDCAEKATKLHKALL